jgi:hypothetical protein
MELRPACHEQGDSRAFYCQIHGTLSLFCNICNSLHATFKIAAKTKKQPKKTLSEIFQEEGDRKPLRVYGIPVHFKPTTIAAHAPKTNEPPREN